MRHERRNMRGGEKVNKPSLASIGIRLDSSQLTLHLYLAALLKERHGSQIHLYVSTSQEAKGLVRDTEKPVWDSLTVANSVPKMISEPVADEKALFEKAREYERLLGHTISRLMMGHRQLNRGYSLGGFNSPRRQDFLDARYAQKVNSVVASLFFWENEISSKQLTLLLDAEMDAAAMASAFGIPYRRLHFARYETRQFWAPDIRQSNPLTLEKFALIKDAELADIRSAYGAATTKINARVNLLKLRNIMFRIPYNILHEAYLRLAGYDRARGSSFAQIVIGPFKSRAREKRLRTLATTTLKDMEGKPFAYFPLHKEPEIAFNQAVPEITSQQASIISVSRDLPAGVILAVKEHLVSVSSRPDDFYDQIAALPNVVLLSPFEDSLSVIRQADVTVAIFGTAGLEAAVLGRPVISFASHMPWGKLPHVFCVPQEQQLESALRSIFEEGIDFEQARRDGARMLQAVIESSFDLGDFRVDRSKTRGATLEHAKVALDGLLESLNYSDVQQKIL